MSEKDTQLKPNILLRRKEDQELRIYFFIGDRPNFTMLTGQEPASKAQSDKKIIYITGFKLEDAFEGAKIKGGGFNLMFTAQSPTVREFLHELELEALAHQAIEETPPIILEPQPAKEQKKQSSPIQMNFERFRSGLLFFANEKDIVYQKPEDRETLKEIISGLVYDRD